MVDFYFSKAYCDDFNVNDDYDCNVSDDNQDNEKNDDNENNIDKKENYDKYQNNNNRKIAAPGALAHRLQRRTACKIQNGYQWAPKWLTGSGKVSIPRFWAF